MKITFPNKTAKEIMEACDNKLGVGKLLGYPEGWYKYEKFYTEEKCRPRTVYIESEIVGLNKDWHECDELVKKEKGEMLNMAEMVYFIQEYFKEYGKYPDDNYSWTTSRSSDGGLVYVGGADAGGVRVDDGGPGVSRSSLGVRFSCSEQDSGAKSEQDEASSDGTLESRIKSLESDMEKIKKFLII